MFLGREQELADLEELYSENRFQLFILYGIIVSLGVGGASNVASTVIVTNWFNEKRGLAFGIMEAGFGAGQMLLVPGSLMTTSATTPANQNDAKVNTILLNISRSLATFHTGCGIWRL